MVSVLWCDTMCAYNHPYNVINILIVLQFLNETAPRTAEI